MRIASASPTTGSALASLASAKPSSGSFLAILASVSEDQSAPGGFAANNSAESSTENHSDTKSADEKVIAQQGLAARGINASSTNPAVSLRSVVDRKVTLAEQKSESVRDAQTSNGNSPRAASEDATAAHLPTEVSGSSFRIAIPITQYSKEIGEPAIVPAAVQSVGQEIASAGMKSVVAKSSSEMGRKLPAAQTQSNSLTNETPLPSVPPSAEAMHTSLVDASQPSITIALTASQSEFNPIPTEASGQAGQTHVAISAAETTPSLGENSFASAVGSAAPIAQSQQATGSAVALHQTTLNVSSPQTFRTVLADADSHLSDIAKADASASESVAPLVAAPADRVKGAVPDIPRGQSSEAGAQPSKTQAGTAANSTAANSIAPAVNSEASRGKSSASASSASFPADKLLSDLVTNIAVNSAQSVAALDVHAAARPEPSLDPSLQVDASNKTQPASKVTASADPQLAQPIPADIAAAAADPPLVRPASSVHEPQSVTPLILHDPSDKLASADSAAAKQIVSNAPREENFTASAAQPPTPANATTDALSTNAVPVAVTGAPSAAASTAKPSTASIPATNAGTSDATGAASSSASTHGAANSQASAQNSQSNTGHETPARPDAIANTEDPPQVQSQAQGQPQQAATIPLTSDTPIVHHTSESTVPAPLDSSRHDSASTVHSDAVEPAGVSSINTAKVLQAMGETEMRVGMHSAEFGDISIRTSVVQRQMVTQISLDHSALSQAISAHVSNAQTKLADDFGLHASIEVRNSATASQGNGTASHTGSGDAGQSSQRQRSSSASAPADISFSAADENGVSLAAITATSSEERLDVRV
jgi:hypothetical protein